VAKVIDLKAADLAAGETAKLRSLTYTPSGGSATTVKALMTGDVTIPAGGGSGLPAGTVDKTLLRWNATAGAWQEIGPYEEIDVVLFTGDRKITGKMLFKATASDVAYPSTDLHKLLQVKLASGGGASYQLGIDYGRLADDE